MAYPTVSAPYGLKPVNLIGGQVFAGSTRLMEIASGYATNIFYGDLVKRISDGTIEKDTGTTTATPVGVFLGVSFTNSSTGQVQQQQFYHNQRQRDQIGFLVESGTCYTEPTHTFYVLSTFHSYVVLNQL